MTEGDCTAHFGTEDTFRDTERALRKKIETLETNSLTEDEIKNKLEYLKNIESRFFGWSLSVQQEVDFAWVVRELKKRLK